jgi:predicted transcriptional regulator
MAFVILAAFAMESRVSDQIKKLAADIVTAYVGSTAVDSSEVQGLIKSVYGALVAAGENTVQASPQVHSPHHSHDNARDAVPAVDPRRSVFKDHLVCLEDGLKFKSIKRHLMAVHGMTVADYRRKWNLPPDYPIVAPGYAETRSRLAKEMGLGKKPAA